MPDAPLPIKSDIRIFDIRGHHVVLDSDLALIYEVTTGNVNKAIKRNADRFPEDFSFVLTEKEFKNLKFQIGISSSHGGRRKVPRVFTEHRAIMAYIKVLGVLRQ